MNADCNRMKAGPDGGRATFDGRHGSMKPEGGAARVNIMAVK
jgi:hypothetical protein